MTKNLRTLFALVGAMAPLTAMAANNEASPPTAPAATIPNNVFAPETIDKAIAIKEIIKAEANHLFIFAAIFKSKGAPISEDQFVNIVIPMETDRIKDKKTRDQTLQRYYRDLVYLGMQLRYCVETGSAALPPKEMENLYKAREDFDRTCILLVENGGLKNNVVADLDETNAFILNLVLATKNGEPDFYRVSLDAQLALENVGKVSPVLDAPNGPVKEAFLAKCFGDAFETLPVQDIVRFGAPLLREYRHKQDAVFHTLVVGAKTDGERWNAAAIYLGIQARQIIQRYQNFLQQQLGPKGLPRDTPVPTPAATPKPTMT